MALMIPAAVACAASQLLALIARTLASTPAALYQKNI